MLQRITTGAPYNTRMAHLIRSAKSGSDWGTNELRAYNIQVRPQSAQSFFGHPLPTLDGIDPLLVSGILDTTDGLTDRTYQLLEYLDLAHAGRESATNFARELLRELGYEERGILLTYHRGRDDPIPLHICGDAGRSAQMDLCLVHVIHGYTTILMIIQEDNPAINARDAEPQVIAEAIAAFQFNNAIRHRKHLPPLASMTIPCVTMVGTRPTFYQVPVTKELSDAVIAGEYPTKTTLVAKCVVSLSSQRLSDGMEAPDFREAALRYFVAFKTLAKSLWSRFFV